MNKRHPPKPRIGLFSVEYVTGRGYFVFDPDALPVAGPFNEKANALTNMEKRQAAADAVTRRGPRACMRCGQTFASEGIHNRMCNPCRAAGLDMVPCSFPARRRRA